MTTAPTVPRRSTTLLACALIAPLGTPIAGSQPRNDDIRNVSIEELKGAYLACDQASVMGRLAGPAVMHCSVVYEELKHRAFGGDFDKLLAWSRANPSTRVSGQ